MKTLFKIALKFAFFLMATILTQIGGIIFIISETIATTIKCSTKLKRTFLFFGLYAIFTCFIIPLLAPIFGREKVKHTDNIKPTTYMTVLLNRNYVRPGMNNLLNNVETKLKDTPITINYLDANFPFINNFPLLPHLSHNDGKKLDLSFIYKTPNGQISNKQKSNSGYGDYIAPKPTEFNQPKDCLNKEYWQYDYPKYLTFGKKNKELTFSQEGSKKLIQAILKEPNLEKIFIEPHLKTRLKLTNKKVRYQGCKAVRHDDHIHIQIK